MVAQYVGKDQRNWDTNIEALQFAYNTAVHDATGYIPAYLNHGRELISPVCDTRTNDTAPAPEEVQQQLKEAYNLVQIQLARSFHRQQGYYDLRRRNWKPTIGEWVWRREHPLLKNADNFNAKLAPKYSKPYKIHRIISPVIVNLQSKRGKWLRHIHIQDLKHADKESEERKTEDEDNNNSAEEDVG